MVKFETIWGEAGSYGGQATPIVLDVQAPEASCRQYGVGEVLSIYGMRTQVNHE